MSSTSYGYSVDSDRRRVIGLTELAALVPGAEFLGRDAADLTDPEACLLQQGVCTNSTRTCLGTTGYRACTALEYGAGYEAVEITCDGLDNDCDGSADNGLPATPCANQEGICAGSFATCTGGGGCARGPPQLESNVSQRRLEHFGGAIVSFGPGAVDRTWLDPPPPAQHLATPTCKPSSRQRRR